MKDSTKNLTHLISEGKPEKISSLFIRKLDEIKKAKKYGFTNKQIVEALNNEGILISENTFRSYLTKYKREILDKETANNISTSENINLYKLDSEDKIKGIKNIKKVSSQPVDIESLSKIFKEVK